MNRSRHILQDFDVALDSLRADVLMMASLTDRNLQNAMACLLEENIDLCGYAIADEEEINELEKTIDGDGVGILGRFQPVASDLRHVVTTLKVSANLERISDQAARIAERVRKLTMPAIGDEALALGPMFVEATDLFRDSIRAFADEDVTLARSLKARDREIDRINHEITDDLTDKMARHPNRVRDYVNLVFIARYLERVGDHAKNIAEEAVYAVEAEDIRYSRGVFSAGRSAA
jgi:phosphate transport system regulatory protein PhoU